MTTIAIEAAGHAIRRFLVWWLGELRALVPARVIDRLRPVTPRLFVRGEGGALVFFAEDGGRWREVGRIAADAATAETTAATVRAMPDAADPATAEVVLILDAACCLRKRLTLPQAAAASLGEVLALDLDRQSPFPPEAVVFDYRVVGLDRARQRIAVDLVIVPRAAIAEAAAPLSTLGLPPAAVQVLDAGGNIIARVPLRAEPSADDAAPAPRRLSLALAGLAAALMVAVFAVPWQQRRLEAAALAAEIAAAREDAERVRAMQAEIDRGLDQGRFVLGRKAERPPVIEVIDEIGRILPDDAWLFRLRIADREVEAFGYSPAASTLIGPIQDAALFTNAQFRAPLMRDPNVDAERFHVAFEIAADAEPHR